MVVLLMLQEEQSHGLWHRGVHFVASEVRDYELDQFQVRVSSNSSRLVA